MTRREADALRKSVTVMEGRLIFGPYITTPDGKTRPMTEAEATAYWEREDSREDDANA